MPERSPSVLIIRLDAIGDALALTPLLAALRADGIPADVVLRPGNADVFSSRAARLIVTSSFDVRSGSRANLAAIEHLGRELRERRYTHAVVATEDPGGYRLARASGAPVRIGFSNGWGKPFKALWSRNFLTQSVYRSAGLDPRGLHECDVLFRLGGALLGAEAAPTRERSQLRPLVIESEPSPDRRVAVQITDKWERLGIAFEQVVDAIERLGALAELRLLASASESRYAGRIARATGLDVEAFATIAPWKAAIAAARALVAPDSGAVHVAGMVGTPVVAVFPQSPDYALHVARWSPWAAAHRIVEAEAAWPARTGDALAQLLSAANGTS
jgi:ADP-heptose:LPS heptosyltransferase